MNGVGTTSVNAGHRFLVYGAFPVGALFDGFLSAALGLVPTIALCAIGLILARIWVIRSPVGRLRAQPVRGGQG
jgi:hypothetical protein